MKYVIYTVRPTGARDARRNFTCPRCGRTIPHKHEEETGALYLTEADKPYVRRPVRLELCLECITPFGVWSRLQTAVNVTSGWSKLRDLQQDDPEAARDWEMELQRIHDEIAAVHREKHEELNAFLYEYLPNLDEIVAAQQATDEKKKARR